jgi:hypothetical protein
MDARVGAQRRLDFLFDHFIGRRQGRFIERLLIAQKVKKQATLCDYSATDVFLSALPIGWPRVVPPATQARWRSAAGLPAPRPCSYC